MIITKLFVLVNEALRIFVVELASVRRHRRAHDVPCDDGEELDSSIDRRNERQSSI